MKYLFAGSTALLIILLSFIKPHSSTIKGTVVDANTGNGIANVTVQESGSAQKVKTNADGLFTIITSGTEPILIFSGTGYKTLKQRVKKDETNILVKLYIPDVEKDELAEKKIQEVSLHQDNISLQGRVAGLAVTSAPYSPNKSRTVTFNTRRYEPAQPALDREGYDAIKENGFRTVKQEPLSTFSIDVDAASYSNVRRMLNMGQLPPAGAVRIEEMINYFKYEYKAPVNDDPFSINTEIAACPWNTKHQLVSVGLQGKLIPTENLPASNLVFLIDVSGSMSDPNKLPLVQQSLKMLVDQLREKDRVALVVYAGSAGLVLPSTSGEEKIKIKDAIDRLEAGGSTAGGAGIQLAYKTAREHFIKGGNNRIILCSDGDFNVGVSSDDALETMIEKERKSGVFLTILGYGMGNYQDAKMQKLANKGNGNHAYIDGISEARKVLVKEFGGTLFAIAKDVKLQVEFNPAKVQAYRLVGYENRLLNNEDFNDDKKDAGELGSGHTVTALYEIIPVGVNSEFIKTVDPLKYQQDKGNTDNKSNGLAIAPNGKHPDNEIMTIKFRYKQPDGDDSKLITHPVVAGSSPTSDNFRFAAAVAQFGMLLRNSEFKQQASYDNAWKLAKGALGNDEEGYRSEFIRLLKNAQDIDKGMSVR